MKQKKHRKTRAKRTRQTRRTRTLATRVRVQKRKRDTQTKRQKIQAARRRVMREIWKTGSITHKRACIVGGFEQARYNLMALVKDGLIKHPSFNKWLAVESRR